MFITAMFRCCYLWSVTFEPIFKKEGVYMCFRLGHIFGTLCIYSNFVLTFILFKMASLKTDQPLSSFQFLLHSWNTWQNQLKEGRVYIAYSSMAQLQGRQGGRNLKKMVTSCPQERWMHASWLSRSCVTRDSELYHWTLNHHSPFVYIWSEQHSFCTSHKIETDIPQGTGSMTKWI